MSVTGLHVVLSKEVFQAIRQVVPRGMLRVWGFPLEVGDCHATTSPPKISYPGPRVAATILGPPDADEDIADCQIPVV